MNWLEPIGARIPPGPASFNAHFGPVRGSNAHDRSEGSCADTDDGAAQDCADLALATMAKALNVYELGPHPKETWSARLPSLPLC